MRRSFGAVRAGIAASAALLLWPAAAFAQTASGEPPPGTERSANGHHAIDMTTGSQYTWNPRVNAWVMERTGGAPPAPRTAPVLPPQGSRLTDATHAEDEPLNRRYYWDSARNGWAETTRGTWDYVKDQWVGDEGRLIPNPTVADDVLGPKAAQAQKDIDEAITKCDAAGFEKGVQALEALVGDADKMATSLKAEIAKAEKSPLARREGGIPGSLTTELRQLERDRDVMSAMLANDRSRMAAAKCGRDEEQKTNVEQPALPPHEQPRPATNLEIAVLKEINDARTDPSSYAHRLRPMPYVDLSEPIAFLQKQPPVPVLAYDPRLALVAIAHEEDQGPKGGESHTGSDGSRPSERMRAAGVQTTAYAEVISIAYDTAGGVLEQLIVDQPGPMHPHRDDLFDPNLKIAGVGCGPNAKFKAMCVIDLAAAALVAGAGAASPAAATSAPAGPTHAAPANPFGPPMPGASVHLDGSWSMTFSDGSTSTFRMNGTVETIFPQPGQCAPPPPGAPARDVPPQVPPPPIKEAAMWKTLDAYERAHPIEDATSEPSISTDGDDTVQSGMLSYFSKGAEIYRVEFNAQGEVTSAGQTPEGRSLDIMKRFNFGYYADAHGITAASLGRTPDGLTYISHVSFTDAAGHYRGFMDFDQTGALKKGIVKKANGDTEARWDGPAEEPRAPAPKLKTLEELNDELDQEDAAQKAANLKAWKACPPVQP